MDASKRVRLKKGVSIGKTEGNNSSTALRQTHIFFSISTCFFLRSKLASMLVLS